MEPSDVGDVAEARSVSKGRFFTGKPCRNGHVSERRVSDGKCLACDREVHRRLREKNPGLSKEARLRRLARNPKYDREQYAKNRRARIAAAIRWKKLHPDRARATQIKTDSKPERMAKQAERLRVKYAANPEVIRARNRAWGKRNTAKKVALNAKRRAALLQRTPKWANQEAIAFFYDFCPKGFHVDHVIPLQGKLVSGLHVENNLQWLPEKDNLRKHHRFDVSEAVA